MNASLIDALGVSCQLLAEVKYTVTYLVNSDSN